MGCGTHHWSFVCQHWTNIYIVPLSIKQQQIPGAKKKKKKVSGLQILACVTSVSVAQVG